IMARPDILNIAEGGGPTPPPGDNLVLIVTHNAPNKNEVALWRKLLTGEWSETSPGSGEFQSTGSALWESLYNEHIAVVHFPVWDDKHEHAGHANTNWLQAIIAHQAVSGEGSFFSERRRTFYFGPFGQAR